MVKVLRYRHLNRFGARNSQWKGVNITYRSVGGSLITSRAGYGRTFVAAIEDADSQLPAGEWTRLVVSTPDTIYTDLQPRLRADGKSLWLTRFEGKEIRVEHRVERIHPGKQLTDE